VCPKLKIIAYKITQLVPKYVTKGIKEGKVHYKLTKYNTMYIYINKDGNPSTKSSRHFKKNVNMQKENQDH